MNRIAWLIILIITCSNCSKKEILFNANGVEYFTFGIAHGYCIGDCAKFYKIENGQLFADNITTYSGSQVSFSSTAMSTIKYELAKPLIENLPMYLINHANTTFGCPDCSDQGGIHVELKQNGVVKTWHIDTFNQHQPDEIKNYITQLITILDQL